mgnify:FL=1|jgi:WD40 repeat protein
MKKLLIIIVLLGFISYLFAEENDDVVVFVQTGHQWVNSIAFSPDGKYVLSGADDSTAKLWEASTGLEINTFVCSKNVYSVAFSPDGRFALTGEEYGIVELWDLSSYNKIKSLKGHKEWYQFNEYKSFLNVVQSVAFSPDGRHVLTGADDGVKLWDVESGREIRTFRDSEKVIHPVAFSPDGRFILTGGQNNDFSRDRVNLWNISGIKIREIQTVYSADSVAFSSDGRYILIGIFPSSIIYDIENSKIVKSFKGPSSAVFSPNEKYVLNFEEKAAILWEVSTGKKIKTFRENTEKIVCVAFSPDGNKILTGSADHTVKLWSVDNKRLLQTYKGQSGMSGRPFDLSPCGRYALLAMQGCKVKLWDISVGQEIRTFDFANSNADTGLDCSAIFSPDGKYILTEKIEDIDLWEVSSGEKIRSLKNRGYFKTVNFSPNGKYVIIGSWDSGAELWDVSSGKAIRSFDVLGVLAVTFSPDSRYVMVYGGKHNYKSSAAHNYFCLYRVSTGEMVKVFGSSETYNYQVNDYNSYATSMAFSPNGKHVVVGRFSKIGRSFDKSALWEVSSGKKIRSLNIGGTRSITFSPDGRYIAAGSDDGIVTLLEASTGGKIRTFSGHTRSVRSVKFSPDGHYVIATSDDGIAILWDASNGAQIKIISGHQGGVSSVKFSPDGEYIFTFDDISFRIWKIDRERELCRFWFFDSSNEWIAITPEGYYNSSPKGHQPINIRFKNKVASIEQFYDVFYRPDIVEHKLKGHDIASLINITVEDALKSPPPMVEIKEMPSNIKSQKSTVSYNVKSMGGGIGEVRIFQNGKLIQSDGFYKNIAIEKRLFDKLASINSRSIYRNIRDKHTAQNNNRSGISKARSKGNFYKNSTEIDIINGMNEISICAFNKDNTIQSSMKTVNFLGRIKEKKPSLFIFSIGINKYKDETNNLFYAAKDSKDFEKKLLSVSKSLYDVNNIYTKQIVNEQATKKYIFEQIKGFSKTVEPNDVFVLFVASHGVLIGDQYYMVTHDYNGKLEANCLISSNDFVEISKQIRSFNQIYILDTCHAGGMDYIISGLYDARMSVLAKKMGLHIFASSSSYEDAIDGYKGNGLFTHHVLNALNNNVKADKNSNNIISFLEIGNYSKINTKTTAKTLGYSQKPITISFGKDIDAYKLYNSN